jgi:hypothetical protein
MFRDYWTAKTEKARKMDWNATFRVWCRTSASRRQCIRSSDDSSGKPSIQEYAPPVPWHLPSFAWAKVNHLPDPRSLLRTDAHDVEAIRIITEFMGKSAGEDLRLGLIVAKQERVDEFDSRLEGQLAAFDMIEEMIDGKEIVGLLDDSSENYWDWTPEQSQAFLDDKRASLQTDRAFIAALRASRDE